MKIVILPVGSTEYHGGHLPLETDWIIPTRIAELLKDRLKEFDIELLSPIKTSPLVSTRESPGSVDVPADKFIGSLLAAAEGVKADLLVILTGHGGKKVSACFALATQEINEKLGLDVAALHYFDAVPNEVVQQKHPTYEHAGEIETSLMLAIAPEKVNSEYKNRKPNYPTERFDWKYPQFKKNIVSMFRKGDTRKMAYWGEPGLATAEKGRTILGAVVDNLSKTIEIIARGG